MKILEPKETRLTTIPSQKEAEFAHLYQYTVNDKEGIVRNL